MKRVRLPLFFGSSIMIMLCMMSPACAVEDVEITNYYPSPAGLYDGLEVRGNAHLALTSGNVGIGYNIGAPTAMLDVNYNNPTQVVGTLVGVDPWFYSGAWNADGSGRIWTQLFDTGGGAGVDALPMMVLSDPSGAEPARIYFNQIGMGVDDTAPEYSTFIGNWDGGDPSLAVTNSAGNVNLAIGSGDPSIASPSGGDGNINANDIYIRSAPIDNWATTLTSSAPRLATGTYVGDGAAGPRTITPVPAIANPKLVWIFQETGGGGGGSQMDFYVKTDVMPANTSYYGINQIIDTRLNIIAGGFTVGTGGAAPVSDTNTAGQVYHYVLYEG